MILGAVEDLAAMGGPFCRGAVCAVSRPQTFERAAVVPVQRARFNGIARRKVVDDDEVSDLLVERESR